MRPTAKRSPSILVTDARSNHRSAPFAGHKSKFSDISVSKLLNDISEVPSARREERRSQSSGAQLAQLAQGLKSRRSLPSRTSKTSQKLVLIPDGELAQSRRGRAARPSKQRRARLSRLTAYLVSDGFSLHKALEFLAATHNIAPRLYDEVLYCPYCLPLLPGRDGYRVKSNVSARNAHGVADMERLIDTSERRDHHFEYYSGVESPAAGASDSEESDAEPQEDDDFDPSEPQLFRQRPGPGPGAGRDLEDHTELGDLGDPGDAMVTHHSEMFIFNYGVVVFWNFTEVQEKNILADIAFSNDTQLVVRPIDETAIEIEQFHFEYDMHVEKPRIFNDIITLRSGDHLIKLTISHAIAQSTKLSRFESRISPILYSVSKLPKRLALTGKLGLKREQLLRKSGKLFKLRVDVNLSSNILDTPEFFWSFEPSLHPLYSATREYLEIDQRVEVLNDRCKVFLEFIDVVANSIAEKNMTRITYMIITVFVMSVIVSCLEIFVRYMIINNTGP